METNVNQGYRKTIYSFDVLGPSGEWMIVNDTVMGGRSQSGMYGSDNGSAVFYGEVSLQNNGGFASVRSLPRAHNLAGLRGIELRVCGDGRRYQIRLKTDSFIDGVEYRQSFDSTNGIWQTLNLDFLDFEAVFRGQVLKNHPRLDPDKIQSIGFMISDKQEGPFQLEIASIRAFD